MADPLPADAGTFQRRREEARPRIALVAREFARLAEAILAEHAQISKRLAALKAFPAVAEDVRAQLARLVTKDFLTAAPFERLQHFPRYLKAAGMRLDKLRADPARDERLMREFQLLSRPFERERSAHERSGVPDPALEQFRWLLEELRVALFAQELKTPVPVSVKRLQKIWESRAR
jgi:ATP-dependent helicase HrpA